MKGDAPAIPDLKPDRKVEADDVGRQDGGIQDHGDLDGAVTEKCIEALLAGLVGGCESVAQHEVEALDERHDQHGQAE